MKNSLWTKTVAVSVADPALLIAVQETWEINIRGIFLEHSYCNHKHKQYPFHLYCNFKIFHHYRRHRLHLKDTSSSSSPSGTVTIREFLKFIGSDVSPAKEICSKGQFNDNWWRYLISTPPEPQEPGFQSLHGKWWAQSRQVSPSKENDGDSFGKCLLAGIL